MISRTLQRVDTPRVHVIGDGVESTVAGLRAMPGRDIWLFGGGALASSLLSMGLIDSIEVAVMPVVLGAGIQLIGEGARGAKLNVTQVRPSSTGIVNIRYDVRRPAG